MLISNKILLGCTVILLNACVCDPPPEKRDFLKFEKRWNQSFYDTTSTLSIMLEPTYKSTSAKNKKFGCVSYHQILGFYFDDTLVPSSIHLSCDQTIAQINKGENWLKHNFTYTEMPSSHAGLPIDYIENHLVLPRKNLALLKDTLHFTIQAKTSKNVNYEDHFSFVLSK